MPDAETPDLPVARVAVDVSLAHLDRFFDYAVLPAHDAAAVPGARVRVRFAGKLRDGFVIERTRESDHDKELTALHKVISAEPVLTRETADLIRAVADHYAGCFADVMRLAIPPRHAATEQAARPTSTPELPPLGGGPGPLAAYPAGPELLTALRERRSPRAAWQLMPSADPSGDWAAGLAAAARACVDGGRGAILVVPDTRDLARLVDACTSQLGPGGFVTLTAEAGPAARYRAFLAALRGDVRVVVGNRAAAYAPVCDLGLVAVFDDGDDLLSEPRAPYPHSRDVLALRAAMARSGAIFAGYARSAEVQQWVERGWLRELTAERPVVRHTAPSVRVTGDSDVALARDPAAKAARLPHEVFELMRAALPQGPVLVQVPRAGYLVALVCQDCREPVRCQECEGPVRGRDRASDGIPTVLECTWCARVQVDWECRICGGRGVRAPVVGSERTAEELGKAFPGTPVRRSSAGHILTAVPGGSAIVVATPGSEPPADGGYAAAVLMDTHLLLLRPDLRAGEEALRRWLNVVALVRSGADGGSVLAVGESGSRALQALVRVDPAGFASRELAERAEAGFPPSLKMIMVEGSPGAVAELVDLVRLPPYAQLLGPAELAGNAEVPAPARGDPLHRLLLRAPREQSAALVRAVKEVLGVRSAHKSEGALRVRVDPTIVG